VRSVSQPHKNRDGRGRQGRAPARGVSRGVAQSFGRRKKPPNNAISRLFGRLRAFLSFRRPMLVMTLGIIVLTALAGLFAPGRKPGVGQHVSTHAGLASTDRSAGGASPAFGVSPRNT